METIAESIKTIETINQLSHFEMCKLWRFAPSGHIYFNMNGPYYKIFYKRFKELGGLNGL